MNYDSFTPLLIAVAHNLWPDDYMQIRWEDDGHYGGMAYWYQGGRFILLNRRLHLADIARVLAHELGHHACKHVGAHFPAIEHPSLFSDTAFDVIGKLIEVNPTQANAEAWVAAGQARLAIEHGKEAEADAWAAAALAGFEQAHGHSVQSILDDIHRAFDSSPKVPR